MGIKAERLTDAVTLYEGDCLEVLPTLAPGSVDAVVTDPPFCSGAATEAGRGSATHQGLRSETMKSGRFEWFSADNMTTSGLVWLLRSMAVQADRLLAETGSMCVFCDWRMITALAPAIESAGFRQRNLCFWNKESFGCGTGFRPQHEVILHLSKRSPDFHTMDVGNVLEFKAKRVPSGMRDHPTEKPVDLIRNLIRVLAPPGTGVVLDPFAGSGVTALAAHCESRKCILIEKDPHYCEIIRRRVREADGTAPGTLFAGVASVPDLFAGVQA